MSNGNLDQWLHPTTEQQYRTKKLSFTQRLNIAIDVASALDYLHHHCETTIVHCDLKPSNVLLDDDMIAHVGDFGLAKFLSDASKNPSINQTFSAALKGSIGYIPPGMGLNLTNHLELMIANFIPKSELLLHNSQLKSIVSFKKVAKIYETFFCTLQFICFVYLSV